MIDVTDSHQKDKREEISLSGEEWEVVRGEKGTSGKGEREREEEVALCWGNKSENQFGKAVYHK